MTLLCVGISYRTASVDVRERYAIPAGGLGRANEKLHQNRALSESALVSTCNRTELVAVARPGLEDVALAHLHHVLHEEIGDGSAAPSNVYELREDEAVRHLFEVAASLDSMVLGEAQILGQVKDAYRAAVEARTCGPILNRLFQWTFRAAKRVRTETGIGASAISIARVGVQLAREIFETFEGKRVLLLGAGEMAESALGGMRDAGVRDFVVVNRSLDAAERLADRFVGEARSLDSLNEQLARADVVICSVAVERPILTPSGLRSALASRSFAPVLIIDLGLPRNADPACNTLDNVYVYDLDDLEGVAARGRAQRAEAIAPARAIAAAQAEAFLRWRASLAAVPAIRELRKRAAKLANSEVERTLAGLGETRPEVRRALERTSEAIIAKILHRSLERLRAEAEEGSGAYYAEAMRRLFDLEENDD